MSHGCNEGGWMRETGKDMVSSSAVGRVQLQYQQINNKGQAYLWCDLFTLVVVTGIEHDRRGHMDVVLWQPCE
jgi:hypothetical protein